MDEITVQAPHPVAANGLQQKPHDQSYKSYYLRAIEQQLQSDSFGGLKLVVGPTGIGKTSAIPAVISYLKTKQIEKRCIYTSHRHLLIQEMADSLDDAQIPFVYLKNDEEVVKTFLQWQGKVDFLRRLDAFGLFQLAESSLISVEKQIDNLRQEMDILERLLDPTLNEVRQRQQLLFRERSSQLLRLFKTSLGHNSLPEQVHQQLMQDPGIWKLFPYIEFLHNPERPVLLVTLQKLLYGFFNGRSSERLLSLEDNIIFLDEFDMQEKEMLSFLCRSPEIQNSFEFVRLFYEEMIRQRQLGHLTPVPGDTERRAKAKERAQGIISKLEADCKQEGFNFPQIRHFSLKEGEFPSNHLSVFQSGVQIMSNPFYLKEREHVWDVVRQPSEDSQRARPLMMIITQTANAILDFFSELWADEMEPEWHSWIEQCYDQKNDNTPGRYKEIINDYGFYRRPSRLATERFDPAIADSIYYQGFNFFRLVRGTYFTTPDEIRIEQKKLTVTPEYLLWRLCNANLVFALSATGDIKRYIQSFDMNWLERYGRYLPIDDQDTALVAQLKRYKEEKRVYAVNLHIASELSLAHPLSRALKQLAQEQFFNRKEEEEANETSVDFRLQAVSRFLETMRWITKESCNQAHLVFLNSFTFIEKLFRPNNGLPDSFYDSIRPNLTISRLATDRSREYLMEIEGQPCQILFLDAAKGREIGDQSFHQIQSDVPLVVVTTYPTASNGVNLKWFAHEEGGDEKSGRDFEGIHLLEAPHFYFSGSNDSKDGIDRQKMFIWQVWKLYYNLQISESQFITALRELNMQDVNTKYKDTTDYLLNQIAVFHQALGRIDRQWQSMPSIDIRLAAGRAGVLEIFEQYLTSPGHIAESRLAREAYTSTLILTLYEQIEKQYLRKAMINQLYYESIAHIESRSREVTGRLLQFLKGVRNGDYTLDDAKKIMALWWRMREAVLKHDYLFNDSLTITHLPSRQEQHLNIDFRQDFVQETGLLQQGEKLFINWEAQRIVRESSLIARPYSLNRYYRRYADNPIIEWYFRTHNYRLRYEPANQALFFTPYIQQNILAGAVGEAALKAVFQHFRMPLHQEREGLPALFEIADMQLMGLPIYVDAKNYSQWTTLYRFAAEPEDPGFDEKLNAAAFLTAAKKKWAYIVAQTGNPNAKLVFINLVARENHPNEGWDAALNPIRPYRFQDSAITVIQGVIDYENPHIWRQDFLDWINEVKAFSTRTEGADDDQ